jgi:hypothetical protein
LVGRRRDMNATYFDTYLRALEKVDDPQGVLGKEWVILPPNPDYGYESTPKNALTFGCMGVDGVHYALLTKNGVVCDDSPVLQVCPMDFSDLYQVKADSFLSFLADACGVSIQKMEAVFVSERAGNSTLAEFLKSHFDMSRLWGEQRTQRLQQYLAMIEAKS